jgi:chromosome segregation ATPase
MNEQDFDQKLGELMGQIAALPEGERSDLSQLAAETRTRHEKMRKTISELQESLDYLRLSVKYLVFDLEATRRENQYLRRLLDRQHGRTPDPDTEPGGD